MPTPIMADPSVPDVTPRTRGAIRDRLAGIPPRWGFWKGALTGAVIEVPALAAAVWVLGRLGLASPDVGFMRTMRLVAVFAGIAAVFTAGGIGRLAAHASVGTPRDDGSTGDVVAADGGRRRAAWVAARAHAAASAGLLIIAAIPGGGLPARPLGWVEIAAVGAVTGLLCGGAIGVICGAAAPLRLTEVLALARMPTNALRHLLDPEDLARLGHAVRDRTTHLFDGMFDPGPRRPAPPAAPDPAPPTDVPTPPKPPAP